MKGIQKAILGIMLLIICLVTVVGIFIYPASGTEKETKQEMNFRLYCIYWRQKQYQGTTVQSPDVGTVDMNEVCTKELKYSCLNYPTCMATQNDWNKCVAACKLGNITGV